MYNAIEFVRCEIQQPRQTIGFDLYFIVRLIQVIKLSEMNSADDQQKRCFVRETERGWKPSFDALSLNFKTFSMVKVLDYSLYLKTLMLI